VALSVDISRIGWDPKVSLLLASLVKLLVDDSRVIFFEKGELKIILKITVLEKIENVQFLNKTSFLKLSY